MIDFTHLIYKELLLTVQQKGFNISTFKNFVVSPSPHTIILRHDVDAKPYRALKMAKIEAEVGVISSYYFRIKTANKQIISEIAGLGHEIGYHYEDFSEHKGNAALAIHSFAKNLAFLRTISPIETAVMHGSPLSAYNNLDLWKLYTCSEYGILAEPYLYFKEKKTSPFFYFTDTGRTWNSKKYNLRDIFQNVDNKLIGEFSNTQELISFFEKRSDSEHKDATIMLTIHPQRWTNNPFDWLSEFVFQHLKNLIKGFIVKM